jgi:hypothetical protein
MEYQEIGEFARHDDTVDLTVSGVLIPLLVSALAEAWYDHRFALPLAFGSAVVWLYWYSVKQRRMGFLLLRLQRARELERIAGLDHHRRIRRTDRVLSPRWLVRRWQNIASVVRIRRVESYVSMALVWAWLFLFLPVVTVPRAIAFVVGVSAIALAGDLLEERRRNRLA